MLCKCTYLYVGCIHYKTVLDFDWLFYLNIRKIDVDLLNQAGNVCSKRMYLWLPHQHMGIVDCVVYQRCSYAESLSSLVCLGVVIIHHVFMK